MNAFQTTRWSLVMAARDEGDAAAMALAELCRRYRAPVLTFVRGVGHRGSEAEDLTQGFFLKLLEKRYHDAADPQRGRFRSFLLSSLKHYLANAHDHHITQKRGGAQPHETLDTQHEVVEADAMLSPERAFERAFALKVVERALHKLRDEAEAAGRGEVFAALAPHALETPQAGDYQRLGQQFGLAPNTVAVNVRRLRERLASLIRDELADTLSDASRVEDEMRQLRAALRS